MRDDALRVAFHRDQPAAAVGLEGRHEGGGPVQICATAEEPQPP